MSEQVSITEQDLAALKKGALEVLVSGKTIFLRGQPMDQTTFVALIMSYLAPFDSVVELRTQLAQAMAARLAKEAEAKEFLKEAKAGAAATFGESSVEFQKMGFSPRKKARALSSDEKKLKVARAAATRVARHTLGSKAKRAVKGAVVAPTGNEGSPDAPSSTSGTKP
jgi:hypothetical protein